jgi:hypothetical protein
MAVPLSKIIFGEGCSWTKILTRLYPGNIHAWGLSIHERRMGAGGFDGFRQK